MSKTFWTGLVGGAAVFGALGLGLGYGAADGMPDVQEKVVIEDREVPGPERTVEVQVPGPERVVEVPGPTVTVERAPDACLRALELADRGFLLAEEGFGYAADGFRAISEYDVDGMRDAAAGMNETAAEIRALAPQYNAAKDECRAASEKGAV